MRIDPYLLVSLGNQTHGCGELIIWCSHNITDEPELWVTRDLKIFYSKARATISIEEHPHHLPCRHLDLSLEEYCNVVSWIILNEKVLYQLSRKFQFSLTFINSLKKLK